MQVGVDTGGTFTDLVTESGQVVKVPSTPDDPGLAVAEAIADAGTGVVDLLAHGTTVATNALLERRGARVALITNAGFEDVIEIARQNRPSLYDPFVDRPEPLVGRDDRLGVSGRLNADGTELVPVGVTPSIPDGVEAVAVCLLHADLADEHERQVAGELEAAGRDVSCSSAVSPEFREYERTSTTVLNAYLRPRCRRYLQGISVLGREVLVMTSAGGLVPAEVAAELPAALLLSGPAAGVQAAAAAAVANGFVDAISFDMGGTSTDVCLIRDGQPEPAAERSVDGYAVRFPSLDIHTIGAGGGSIAAVDAGGALVVGPRSAGAMPGPACYGHGGVEPTVTDANVALGRIADGADFGGLTLSAGRARRALDEAGVDAAGVIAVVNANMQRALRTVSVERGVDPRGLALVAFGGAGPLHACELAEALEMAAVIVPARAGVLSAVGLLGAPVQRDLVRSWAPSRDHAELGGALDELGTEVSALVGEGAEVTTAIDCRYAGQSHEITVPTVADFPAEHERRNGTRLDVDIEVVALRATARHGRDPLALPDVVRAGGTGPAALSEPDCTIWLPEGWTAEPGAEGALVLRRESPAGFSTSEGSSSSPERDSTVLRR